jgi:deoxyribodipyrimidine photolyase
MLWKDYFVFWALKHHKMYFTAEYGIYNRTHYDWQTDPDIITQIKKGQTGMPIIDAIVRDFNEAGNMSYKAKMIF